MSRLPKDKCESVHGPLLRERYTLPRVDDFLDAVAGSRWFIILDQESAYSQIPVVLDKQNKIAFSTPFGL